MELHLRAEKNYVFTAIANREGKVDLVIDHSGQPQDWSRDDVEAIRRKVFERATGRPSERPEMLPFTKRRGDVLEVGVEVRGIMVLGEPKSDTVWVEILGLRPEVTDEVVRRQRENVGEWS